MKIFYKLKLSIFIIILILFSSVSTAQEFFIDSPNPPPGFEAANINQHLRVSVFFMNQYVGFYYIDIYQGRLKFNSPRKLLSQLSGIKHNKNILKLLSQSFPMNIECYSNGMIGIPDYCQKLKKLPLYIIYKPQQEIVYLYLAAAHFIKPKKDNTLEFIPNSSSDWSYINKLGATGSFSGHDPGFTSKIYASTPNYYNFYSNNVFAYKNTSLIGNISQNNGVNDGERFQVQNLYGQYILRDKVYTAGYIANSSSPFFQTQTILGASITSTLDTLKNLEDITATPLVIFVPQSSQISIFKNAQLIFSQYLEAGYQRINTSSFPQGGYELTVKIGSSTISRTYFTKGLSLPPVNATQFYLSGGYLTNGLTLDDTYNFLPSVLNVAVVQAGINKRVSQKIALFSDILLNSHQGLIDFGPTFFWGNSFIKAAGLLTTKNNYGLYTMFNTQKNRLNLSLIFTKIFYKNRHTNYFFLNDLVDNDSISVSYRLSEYDLLGIQANYNKTLHQDITYNGGIFYQREIGNYKGMSFFFNAAYNKAVYMGESYNLSITMNFSQDKLAGTESVLWQSQMKNSKENQLALPVVVQGSTVYSQQNERGAGYSVNEIHTISPKLSSIAGIYNYTNLQSFTALYVNYNQVKKSGYSLGFGGNLETELAVTRNTLSFNGLERGNTAGIIIRVATSNTKDHLAKFALLDENNRKIAIFPPNQNVFISLPKFTDQNYTLMNLSRSDYFINEPTRHVTLYPGNVGYYLWRVEKRIIVIGRVKKKSNGQVVSNTWIHAGENGIFTDIDGNFQLELPQNTTVLEAENICHIQLPKLNVDKAYLYMGDVLCA